MRDFNVVLYVNLKAFNRQDAMDMVTDVMNAGFLRDEGHLTARDFEWEIADMEDITEEGEEE